MRIRLAAACFSMFPFVVGCPRTEVSDARDGGAPNLVHGDAGNDTGVDAGKADGGPRDSGPVCNVGTPSGPLQVATVNGVVAGAQDGETRVFKGIPFAAPPVGDLRFRPPQPPACWTDVRDATQYGSRCVQRVPGSILYSGDEDCLFLNVWTPAGADAGIPTNKPVMFFIHGGANILGSANEDGQTGFNLYDARALSQSQDVVVVSINYRLGSLGFLAHPSLTAEDVHHTSGNYALMDMLAALHWVQDNISSLGGDPGNVMVFGESAGALNTCMLVASPLAAGLFHAALMESGDCIAPPLSERETTGVQLALSMGCNNAADAAACLRGKTANDITSLTPVDVDMLKVWNLPFGPNVDGYVLPRAPLETIRRGEHNHMPFIVGTNAHETELFLPAVVNTCLDYAVALQASFPLFATSVLTEYPCLSYLLPRWAAVDATTDLLFTCPARRIARTVAAAQTEPVRRYHYKHIRPYGPLAVMRAFHASELPYVFGTVSLGGYLPLAVDNAVTTTLQGYWGRFAAHHDPNGASAVDWPAYDVTHDTLVDIDDTVVAVNGLASAHCDFWDNLAQ